MKFLIAIVVVGLTIGSNAAGGRKKYGKDWTKGKRVKAEGSVSVTALSREEFVKRARHESEEQGKLREFDPAAVRD